MEREQRNFMIVERVSFTITKEMLFSYDMNLNRWKAEEGYYDLIIAKSAADFGRSESGA